MYALPIAAIPEFRLRRQGRRWLDKAPGMLPKELKLNCYKETAVGEFVREQQDGVPVLGVGVINAELSPQFAIELETDKSPLLTPCRTYRLKVEYRTANDGHGTFSLQVPNTAPTATTRFRTLAGDALPTAPGGWATAALDFTRVDGLPVRLTIDPKAVSPGSMLFVRSVEVVESK